VKLFEYEAKNILHKYGIAIPYGKVAKTPEEAFTIASEIGKSVFVKSQITVSGRGKAGGILSAQTSEDAKIKATKLLGHKIKDIEVRSLLIEEKLNLEEQYYASIAIDRQLKTFIVLVSKCGGVDIEEVSKNNPQEIHRLWIDPVNGLTETEAEKLSGSLKLNENDTKRVAAILSALYTAAIENDAELVEINPLVKTVSGEIIAADARIIVDDNAIFRHPEYAERNFQREEDTPRETEARKHNFAYVDLDGDIGIIGNGAGLVMASLDTISYFGGKPANFLDIGGGAQVEVIKSGVLLVMGKPEVKAVLINILGGITRCDLVATGVVEGLKASPAQKPIAVRMMGTNEKEGQEILRQNGISFYADMEQAAEAAVKMSASVI
jgi:succinyl-CoA synthetase beta subunit